MPSNPVSSRPTPDRYTTDYKGTRIRMMCPGNVRHWFTAYGRPGVRAPTCRHCGAPNPKPLTPDELREYKEGR